MDRDNEYSEDEAENKIIMTNDLDEELLNELNAQINDIFNQGLANYSEGEYQDAINVWETVLEKLDPNDKSTLEYIQKAKERLKILSDIE